jgi:hypothetical protein
MSGDIDIGSLVSEAYGEAETTGNDVASAGASAADAGGVGGAEAPPDGVAAGADPGASGSPRDGAADSPGEVESKGGRDEKGRFAPKTKDAAAKAKAPKEVAGAQSSAGVLPPLSSGDSLQAAPPPAEVIRAPASLTPSEREHFAKAPVEVQKAFARLDKEVRQTMQEAAPARKFQEEYQRAVIGPYQGMLQRAGLNPIQATQSAFNTIDQLINGTPESRAQVFHALMQAYPTSLEVLAAHIERGPQPQQQQQQTHQAMDPNAIVSQVLQAIDQRRGQAASARQEQEIQMFADNPANEFFGDVGHEMLAMLRAAKERRVELSMKDAYDRACRANPEVWEILQKRSKADAAKAATASTQQALRAASSVRSTPSSGASSQGSKRNESIRDVVAGSWDSLEGA